MPTASAKTREMIMAGKIFGAAEGLRPKARMAANPIAAITADGPKIVRNMTSIMIKLRIAIFRTFEHADFEFVSHWLSFKNFRRSQYSP
jgi:hypothetical protein